MVPLLICGSPSRLACAESTLAWATSLLFPSLRRRRPAANRCAPESGLYFEITRLSARKYRSVQETGIEPDEGNAPTVQIFWSRERFLESCLLQNIALNGHRISGAKNTSARTSILSRGRAVGGLVGSSKA